MKPPGNSALESGAAIVRQGLAYVRGQCSDNGRLQASRMDDWQQAIYDLAIVQSELQASSALYTYASEQREFEAKLATCFAAEALAAIRSRLGAVPTDYGLGNCDFSEIDAFVAEHRSARTLASLGKSVLQQASPAGERGLDAEKTLMADTFAQFAQDVVAPLAEQIHY